MPIFLHPPQTPIVEIGSTGPAVLVLGPLHGDERVSATAAFHLVTLLATRARGDPWLARLVRTRRLVVVPLPSAAAYDRHARFEDAGGAQLDPAGDFPFARAPGEGGSCLRSSAARVVDALFRNYAFVVTLQLADARGQEDSISFSWAAGNSLCRQGLADVRNASVRAGDLTAPCSAGFATADDEALSTIAGRMAAFAGPSHHADSSVFRVGANSELFPPRHGSLLDYAYGGSAHPELVAPCAARRPTNTSHRSASFQVRASREAAPDEQSLGMLSELYNHEPRGNVVTRILRAALAACDFAFPYVVWLDGGEYDFEARGGIAHIRWSVGGAATVQQSWLTCRLDGDVESEWRTPVLSGRSMWSQSFDDRSGLAFHKLHELSAATYEFRQTLLLYKRMTPRQRGHGCRLLLKAEALVDAEWIGSADAPPQSHLVQLRSNVSWFVDDRVGGIAGLRNVTTGWIEVDVPPVSGFGAFLEYVWNFLLLALIVCVVPPAALLYCTRRAGTLPSMPSRGGFLLRQRVRSTFRRFRARDSSAGGRGAKEDSRPGYRDMSASNLLGAVTLEPRQGERDE